MKIPKIYYCLFALFMLFSCNIFDEGKNTIVKEFYNPQKSLKVIVFEKSGNATANNSIQVSIESKDYKLTNSDNGNTFIADKKEFLKLPNDSLILVKWFDNKKVEINYPSDAEIFKIEESVESEIGKVKVLHNSRKKS
ncbi:hypothetical protein [Flavobacterium limnophilum]|uniref:hypothetical protein n=1 Tax=Flavobacterium limnophilum TaxID=3003262 RepID=UPI0022ABCC06|nr:hypothetical protein [Flavobacterium limnophilum]